MSVNGKFDDVTFDDITREDILAEADRFGVSRPSERLNQVRSALMSWPGLAKDAGLSDSASDRVAADFRLL
jgi:hypothetical protein